MKIRWNNILQIPLYKKQEIEEACQSAVSNIGRVLIQRIRCIKYWAEFWYSGFAVSVLCGGFAVSVLGQLSTITINGTITDSTTVGRAHLPLACHYLVMILPLTGHCLYLPLNSPLTSHSLTANLLFACHLLAISLPLTCHWLNIIQPLAYH